MSNLNIFTLNWNGKEKISKLYKSMKDFDIPFTWHIKDNASKDGSIDEIKSWNDHRINLIEYQHNNDNFAQGMNYLFEQASPNDNDLILLLNNDVIFNDNSLAKMIAILNSSNDVGAVGARLLYTNTNRLQHAGVVIDDKHHMPTHFRLNEVSDEDSKKNREFQVVTGAVVLLRAGDYKTVCQENKSGRIGMDETYHWAFEDVDLCLAIHYNLNKKIVYCGSTNIFHEESASLKKNPANKLFMNHNTKHFKEKWSKIIKIDKQDYIKNKNHKLYLG